ncbi:MAG: 2-oxoacid:ferredoxin oxidoreductase subunit beta [Candidatus Hydrogenedentota bacterium]
MDAKVKERMTNPMHNYLRPKKKFPTVWCAGCGNGIVLQSIVSAIDSLGLDRNKVVLVSGIGCSSRAPVYVDFNSLHTTHGRAIAFASGVKFADPQLKVIVITGDGDAVAIGGNHFIHACRRNMDITAIVFNNYIYGMTGGQVSPTTPQSAFASTSPHGNIDQPFDICELAIGAGASFVARTTVAHPNLLYQYILQGLKNNGFSVIEVLVNCPTNFGRRNKLGDAVNMIKSLKEMAITMDSLKSKWMKEQNIDLSDLEKHILTGIFTDIKKPRFIENYASLIKRLQRLKD